MINVLYNGINLRHITDAELHRLIDPPASRQAGLQNAVRKATFKVFEKLILRSSAGRYVPDETFTKKR